MGLVRVDYFGEEGWKVHDLNNVNQIMRLGASRADDKIVYWKTMKPVKI